MKECIKCKTVLELSKFPKAYSKDGRSSTCKKCNLLRNKELTKERKARVERYSEVPKFKLLSNSKLGDDFDSCSKCKELLPIKEFNKDSTSITGYHHLCKPCNKIKTSKYYQDNKARRNEYQLKRHHERMKSDPLYVLKKRYRSRTRKMFRNKKCVKITSSMSFLGCTAEEFTKHFESLFTDGMSWDKVFSGEIEIDHIHPIGTAQTEEEIIKLSHYTNLQPLWADVNRKKSNKLPENN